MLDPHSRLTVDPGTRPGQAGQQQGHPPDVPVVLARLVRTTVNHVVQLLPVDARIAILKRARIGTDGEVIRSDGGQGAAVAAERRPYGVAEIDGTGLGHGSNIAHFPMRGSNECNPWLNANPPSLAH